MKTLRGLSRPFINNLQPSGSLWSLLSTVQSDDTLDLQIRENYVNIYYRGGNIIRIVDVHGVYVASFDRRYILDPIHTHLPDCIGEQKLCSQSEVEIWVRAIPLIKHEMDRWFHVHPKDEREAQQIMVRENNYGDTATGTDYFICDIEYANPFGRFDLIAVEWPSSSSERKNNKNLGLAFIEMKYADKSLKNTSRVCEHIRQMCSYYQRTTDNFAVLKEEMRTVFNQKHALGLIKNQKPIESFNAKVPDFIFAIANHDPESTILRDELGEIRKIEQKLPFALKFATSNFMGYGLYKQNILTLDEFERRVDNGCGTLGPSFPQIKQD